MKTKMNRKGVAGLSTFSALIVMIFVIGLLVATFGLVGNEMQDAIDDNTTDDLINDTTVAIGTAVDWFDLFIVIGAVVVLISLIVIVILLIRRSGMMGGGA